MKRLISLSMFTLLLLSVLCVPVSVAHAASIYYVMPTAAGLGDCSSWANACGNLQKAISIASSGDEIWVGQGTYLPPVPDLPELPRTATFRLKAGVALYGGFAGTENLRSDRPLPLVPSVLSGDIGTSGNASDNSYHVVTDTDSSGTATLDGFTISGGNANYQDPYSIHLSGAGMYVAGGGTRVILQHVTFTGNTASTGLGGSGSGGGLYVKNGNVTLSDVIFTSNSAKSQGGGAYIDQSSATLSGVTFTSNSTDGFGGGMFTSNASVSLANVTFTSNTGDLGAGLSTYGTSSPQLSLVTFTNNTAGHFGGGYQSEGATPTLKNVTFSGNSAYIGGGMSLQNGVGTLTNVSFQGNSGSYQGGGMRLINAGSSTLTNVIFSGNVSSGSSGMGGGIYNNSSNTTLTNVTFNGNSAAINGGAAYVTDGSAVSIRNSILWNNGSLPISKNEARDSVAIVRSIVSGGCPIDASCSSITTSDPLFTIPVAPTGAPTTGGDMHLQDGSPAVDAGDNSFVTVSTDLGGNLRRQDAPATSDTGVGTIPIVDLGAYEHEGVAAALSISKTNSVSGATPFATFNWTLTVKNTGDGAAYFANGDVLLRDNLPIMNADYGTPLVQNSTGLGGSVVCAIIEGDLACMADGAVSLAATNGQFDVVVPVIPVTVGTLTNPRNSGVCAVDPDNLLPEVNEVDNTCTANSVSVSKATPTLTTDFHNTSHAIISNASIGESIHNHIEVTGESGVQAPSGSNITFRRYAVDDPLCSGTPVSTEANLPASTAESTSFSAASFYYRVTYGGDDNYNSATSSCVLFVALQPGPTFTVNTTIDDAGDGLCSDAHCTLREAIDAANEAAGANTIHFGVGDDQTLTFSPALPTIMDTSGALTIDGETHSITISGSNNYRVFYNASLTSLILQNLTVANGSSSSNGGGINNLGTLTANNCAIIGNATSSSGGGIYNQGTLYVNNSTFNANTTTGSGGSIYNAGSSTTTLVNSTLSGNNATVSGGGIYNLGTLTANNSIITNNTGDNCSGTIAGTHNLANDDTCGTGFSNSTSILLGALGNYGGSTKTFPLLPGSLAIDAGDSCPSKDQRGIDRPQGTTCDIGAFESRGFIMDSLTGTPQHAAILTSFGTKLGLTVTARGSGEPVDGGYVTFTPPASGASATLSSTYSQIMAGIIPLGVTPAGQGITATANSVAGGPYNVVASTSGAASVNFSLTNDKGAATVNLSDLNQNYDRTPKPVSVSTTPSGLTVIVTYDGAATPPTNAGSYAVVATVNDASYQGSATDTLVVAQQAISISAVSDSKMYDGTTDSSDVPVITAGSLVQGDTAAWTQTFDNKNVGTGKTLTPAGTVNDGNDGHNYAVTLIPVNTGEITTRPIILFANAKSKTYGDPDPSFTYQVVEGSLAPGEEFSGSLARDAGENVNSYPIRLGSLSAGSNYTLYFEGSYLSITARPLKVTANEVSKIYGDPMPAFSVSYEDLVNGDDAGDLGGTLEFDTTASAASSLGDYPVTPKGLTSTNYTISFSSGVLHVLPIPVDLSLTQTASESTLLAGSNQVYTFVVANHGSRDASQVRLVNVLSSGSTFRSGSQGCTEAQGTVTCDLGAIPTGASRTVTLTVSIGTLSNGTLSNTGTLAGFAATEADTNPGDNSSTVSFQVLLSREVYNNTVESGPGAGWCSDVTTSTTPTGGRHFLGEFSNQKVCLSVPNLPAHSQVTVSFDLFVIRSWDGGINDGLPGPDEWQISAGDGQGSPATLLHTTFNNWANFSQAYPGPYPENNNASRTGAVENNTLGFFHYQIPMDAVYHPTFTFDHVGDTLQLDFEAMGLQEIEDESWGLDNIRVTVSAGADLQPYKMYLPYLQR